MSNFADILNAVKKMKDGGGAQKNDRENFWSCETDKAGNGFAIIRFLPAPGDQLPFVKLFDHGFQGPGGWYIEKCPTTIGKECPVCEANGPLWNSGRESDKEIVRKRKRRTSFITNILVVSDPKNPDNEGKVFLFKFGKKIFDKISDAMQPPEIEVESGEATPINPFDPSEGANFKLKIRRVEGYANFDKSEFEASSEIELDESKLFALSDYTDEKSFKDYDALKARFVKATGGSAGVRTSVKEEKDEDVPPWDEPTEPATQKISKPVKVTKVETPAEDDDDMAFFRNLANDE